MNLTDTHSHIYLNEFSTDTEETIQRAMLAGIGKILLPNIDRSSLREMNELAEKFPDICFPMIGLHPGSVKKDFEDELSFVETELEMHKYYGIGETGIDLYWDKTFFEQQVISFRHHLELAIKYDLPVVIHSRDSFDEVMAVIMEFKDTNLRGVFHAFSGNSEQAARVIDLNFKLGIGGVLTYKKSNLPDVIKYTGLSPLVLETDAPFLPPLPKRGMRNEPSFMLYTALKLAEITETDLETVSSVTGKNVQEIFRIH